MSGDLYIPDPFSARHRSGGHRIMNALGTQAAVFGNTEFDLGTSVIADLIAAEEPRRGRRGDRRPLPGTPFPYLSSNLDFSNSNLADFVVADGQEASTIPNSIARSTVITAEGETFGVVGVTTPLLPSISSPGDVVVSPSNPSDFAALAAMCSPSWTTLSASGIDKIVLLAHLQQLAFELELAPLLRDVDINIAGGSDTLWPTTATACGRATRAPVVPAAARPASGEPVAVVNTSREYRYVGRLVAGFDAAGVLSEIREESGAYADRPRGRRGDRERRAHARGRRGDRHGVREVVTELDGEIFGATEVFLNGQRESVRTEETNLGNLSADAQLLVAREVDPTVAVSLKNGGGIRASIGAFALDGTPVPPLANPLTAKRLGRSHFSTCRRAALRQRAEHRHAHRGAA
jgi:2',3'-cyclic-nucleotide 2'-phosphodiesterase (5'-nucleotidase family)